MIKHLKGLNINSIYDFDNSFSINELLCKFWEKIEETINISNESIDILNWVKDQGLSEEVEILITKLVEDGTFERMINVDKIDKVKALITNKFTDVSSQLDTKANKNEIFTMANMGQDIKEAMTGGSVAVVGIDCILEENIVNNQVTPNKTSFARRLNEFDFTTSTQGKRLNYPNDNLTDDIDFNTSDYIEVEPGNYTLNIANYDTIFLYNADKNLVNKIKLSGWGIVVNTIQIEDNVKYVRLCYLKEHEQKIMFIKGDVLPKFYCDHKSVIIENLKQNAFIDTSIINDGLIGTYLFSGDSICYGAGYKGGYASLIENRNQNATIKNYGISGTKIAKIEGNTDSILERIESMQNEADFIIFEGGVNDAWSSSIQLGDFNSNSPITTNYINNLDEYTFSGALESLFNKAQNKWLGKKIFFIIPHNMDIPNTKPYMDRAEEISNKWGVILIDLRKLSGLNTYNTFMKENYTDNSDGVHPNQLGYENFYIEPITNILKQYTKHN